MLTDSLRRGEEVLKRNLRNLQQKYVDDLFSMVEKKLLITRGDSQKHKTEEVLRPLKALQQ